MPPPATPVAEAVAARLASIEALDALARLPDPLQAYESRVFLQDSRLGEMLSELRRVSERLPASHDLVEARVWAKFYIITWCSLSDVLACLIAEVFDLGIDHRDLDLTMVLRNRHVSASVLPSVLARYSASIAYPTYAGLRNNIVHRGHLEDPELLEFDRATTFEALKRWAKAPSSVTDEQVKAKLQSLLGDKARTYAAHLSNTEAMLQEMSAALASVVAAHPTSGAV